MEGAPMAQVPRGGHQHRAMGDLLALGLVAVLRSPGAWGAAGGPPSLALRGVWGRGWSSEWWRLCSLRGLRIPAGSGLACVRRQFHSLAWNAAPLPRARRAALLPPGWGWRQGWTAAPRAAVLQAACHQRPCLAPQPVALHLARRYLAGRALVRRWGLMAARERLEEWAVA